VLIRTTRQVSRTRILRAEPAAERGRVDVVDERALAVELDDRNPLAVASLELGIAADVHLLELETELVERGRDHAPRPLTEVAAVRVIQDYARGRVHARERLTVERRARKRGRAANS